MTKIFAELRLGIVRWHPIDFLGRAYLDHLYFSRSVKGKHPGNLM